MTERLTHTNSMAPIALFIYRRPEHLRATIQSLIQCPEFDETAIVVFGDGPRRPADQAAVEQARAVARELLSERATFRFSDANLGLSRSIILGVTSMVARYGRVIVLEDDLELSPAFLTYMNAALDRYASDSRVMQVSGHMFDVPAFANRRDAMFLPLTSSWGWATWKRAWDDFDEQAQGWERLLTDPLLRRSFNLRDAYDYAAMLERQMKGVGDSWAVRWYWSVFKQGGLAVFPPAPMVQNTGMDRSGTHGRGVLRKFDRPTPLMTEAPRLPVTALPSMADFDEVRQAIWRQNGGWIGSAVDRLRRLARGMVRQ